jgi:hypothetical protein
MVKSALFLGPLAPTDISQLTTNWVPKLYSWRLSPLEEKGKNMKLIKKLEEILTKNLHNRVTIILQVLNDVLEPETAIYKGYHLYKEEDVTVEIAKLKDALKNYGEMEEDNFTITSESMSVEDYDGDDEGGRPIIREIWWEEITILEKRELTLSDYEKALAKATERMHNAEKLLSAVNYALSPSACIPESVREKVPNIKNIVFYSIEEARLEEYSSIIASQWEEAEELGIILKNEYEFVEDFLFKYMENFEDERDEELVFEEIDDTADFEKLYEIYKSKDFKKLKFRKPQPIRFFLDYKEAYDFFASLSSKEPKKFFLVRKKEGEKTTEKEKLVN